MIRQIPLELRWPPHQRLDAYWPGVNAAAWRDVSDVARRANDAWLYLHGPPGTGKSHLLIGACRAALEAGRPARYASLASLPTPRAAALGSIDTTGLLALDDLGAVAGDRDGERALFDLYNRALSAGADLLFAAAAPVPELGVGLPDLASRLARCTQHALHPLEDADRRAMLRMLAQRLGLRLDDDVLDWWLARQPRDSASLVGLLQRIDRASLAAQRRVTIPFLRELLRDGSS